MDYIRQHRLLGFAILLPDRYYPVYYVPMYIKARVWTFHHGAEYISVILLLSTISQLEAEYLVKWAEHCLQISYRSSDNHSSLGIRLSLVAFYCG